MIDHSAPQNTLSHAVIHPRFYGRERLVGAQGTGDRRSYLVKRRSWGTKEPYLVSREASLVGGEEGVAREGYRVGEEELMAYGGQDLEIGGLVARLS